MDVTKIPLISNLPPELIFYILSFLSLKDLSRAGSVNKQFHSIVQDCRRILSGAGKVHHLRLLKKFIKGDTWRDQYLWVSTQREKQKEAFVLMNQLLFKEAVALLTQYDLGGDLALMLKDALNMKQISLRAAGEFLTNKDYSHVIDGFIEYFDFQKMELSEALRKLLVSIKLPNTQSIGPIMEKFAKKYLRQNPDRYANAAAVSNLAFSIYLICNTEEGFPRQIPLPQKKFIDNARGINDGKDFPLHYLETTYERVIHTNSPLSENSTKFPMIGSPDFWHIVMNGWMYKQGMDLLRSWKRRWFVLTSDGNLYYYRKPTETPLGVIKVSEIVVSRFPGRKPGLKLMITTKSGTSMREHYYVTMDTEEEATQWMDAILSHPEYSERKHKSAALSPGTPPDTPRKAASAPASRVPSKIEEIENSETPYFGYPLEKILEREGTVVPLLVQTAVDDLVATALDEEGILRLSGSMVEMGEIRSEIEHGKIDFTRRDPHAVAGILKSFFRELPEPIISREYNTAITAMLGYGSGPEVVEEIRNVIRSLPTPNFELWKIIVAFLLHVDAHSDKNKMPVANLLRVMTPTLNCAPGLISMSMEQYSYFFDDVVAQEEPEHDDLFDDISKSFQNILEQEKAEVKAEGETVRKKKNRRHRKSMELSPSEVAAISEEAAAAATPPPETPRSRRRHKNRDNEEADVDSPASEKKEKKKKKEKKEFKMDASMDSTAAEGNKEESIVEGGEENEKKEKKKKKEKKEFRMDASMDSVIEENGEVKKKHRKKKTESAVSSPRLSLELDNSEVGSSPREKSKKSRKKKPVAIESENNDTKIIIEVEGTEITI